MKYLRYCVIAMMLNGFMAFSVQAVQINVEDVSGKIITCDAEKFTFLQQKPGSCIANPSNTFAITVTSDSGEDTSIPDELHVFLMHNGKPYKYNSRNSGIASRWDQIPTDVSALASGQPSITKAPWEKSSISRHIYLEDFGLKKGAAVYVIPHTKGAQIPGAQAVKHILTVQ